MKVTYIVVVVGLCRSVAIRTTCLRAASQTGMGMYSLTSNYSAMMA